MSPAGVRITPVTAAAVRPLRSRVLRPGVPPEALVYDGDETPDALHLAALGTGGELLGIASLCREPAARHPGVEGWRLRGMATLPEVRGRGLGARLLRGCFAHVRAHGGGLLWCNARLVALGFYARLGLRREGELFDIPGIGPHYVMSRLLAQLRPARAQDAAHLSALALRSKALWGGVPEFIARCEPALRVSPADFGMAGRHVTAARIGGQVLGFSVLQLGKDGTAVLDALFVEPEHVRRGVGRELLEHAVELARSAGARHLVAAADPQALGFYQRLGLRHEGEVPSEVDPTRRLPRVVLALS